MSDATVIAFPTKDSEEQAWAAYADHAARAIDEPRLLINRDYMRTHATLHERWRRIFLQVAS